MLQGNICVGAFVSGLILVSVFGLSCLIFRNHTFSMEGSCSDACNGCAEIRDVLLGSDIPAKNEVAMALACLFPSNMKPYMHPVIFSDDWGSMVFRFHYHSQKVIGS